MINLCLFNLSFNVYFFIINNNKKINITCYCCFVTVLYLNKYKIEASTGTGNRYGSVPVQ